MVKKTSFFMGSPERVKSSMKWVIADDVEVNIDSVRDDEDWDGNDKTKRQSSRSRKLGNREEADGLSSSGRKRSFSDSLESQKIVGAASRADSDQDNYETREDPQCKQLKQKMEENTLDVLSTWYQDGDVESKNEGDDKPGTKESIRGEVSDINKSTFKHSEHDADGVNVPARDSRDSARRDSTQEKGYGYVEHGRNHRRRWDEPDITVEYGKKYEVKSSKSPGPKLESITEKERSRILEIDSNDIRIRNFDSTNDTGSHDREELQIDVERSKRGKSLDEDNKGILTYEDGISKEIFEEHRKLRNSTRDIIDDNVRPLNPDEDGNTWTKDRSRRDPENFNTSWILEKIGRRELESDNSEIDYDRSIACRRKDAGKDASWNDRSKGRDDDWGDRKRDRDNTKDAWKRRQDKETRDNETPYDNIRDWELPRRGRERIDGRSSGRKDGNRTEAVKTSSKYGISNENYDVIEIQTKPFDHGREDSRSTIVKNEVIQQSDLNLTIDMERLSYSREERSRNVVGSVQSGEDTKDKFMDSDLAGQGQLSWKDDGFNAEKSSGQNYGLSNRGKDSQSSSGGSVLHGNQEPGSFSRNSQGVRGNRFGRIGRGRPSGRDSHQGGIPIPLAGSPFGPLGLPPPGPMQSLPSNMSPAPGHISPGVFIPPFQPPIVWPGARGVEMNMLGTLPGLSPIPPGPLGPRFSPNLGNGPSSAMVFSPSGPGGGMPPSMSGPNSNAVAPMLQGPPQDKGCGGWVPPRINAPPGKAPSRGEQNDYSQNFVDTGMRPQNFIRELELTSVVEDYPKLRELIQKKDEIVAKSASPPMYYKCDLRDQVLSTELFGTKFDVILIDPPWEEYVHRAPGVTDHMEYWTFEEIMNLKIEAIADTPSFIFLWVGDGVGLEQGRQCLKKWGFRRCEDICWVKTNKSNAIPGLRHDSYTLFQRSKEHCLMGIKGTVRRSTDGHIIHANIDTDVIIAEEPPYGSTVKPEDMYRIVEHFALGRRRLELFGEDHNIRAGWLTIGKGLSSSNFNSEAYVRNFADKDGKVWAGVGGRNPPPEAPHLVQTTPDIESLRPKSPMKNQQQQQQQHSTSISLTMGNSSNRRPAGNSPQRYSVPLMNQEPASSTTSMPSLAPWASPMEVFKERGGPPSDDRMFDAYATPYGLPPNGEFLDYGSDRGSNML